MNWKTVIADIQRHGQMTQPQIAKAVGCSQTTVSELSIGKSKDRQPNYQLGAALLALLADVQAKERAVA